MKYSIRSSFGLALLLALAPLAARAASPSGGYIDFGKFSAGGAGNQFVEVNINSNLIAMAAKLSQKSQPEVADALQGLQSVRVNVIGVTDENRSEIEERIKTVRAQLDGQGWERIVTAQDKKQDVGVYLKTRGQEAVEGIVVTVLDGKKQAVFVNVVGDIRPDKLALIGERFNIDPLKKLGPAPHKKPHSKEE